MNPKTSDSRHQTSVIKHQTNTKYQASSIGHRLLALFLTFTVLLPTVTPYNNLWANNNGPVAPEAASFEPVDAADMVNLLTGDVSYVLPLLNIPSPEGGYPMALSYHAGISLAQEASWTGLGWNVNPGAINRFVSGVPDDVRRVESFNITYDKGGVAEGFSVGLNLGWKEGLYSIGMYASYVTNKTFAGENSSEFDFGITGSAGSKVLDINASYGTDGYGIGLGVPILKGKKGKGTADIYAGYHSENGFSAGASISPGRKSKLKNATFGVGFGQTGGFTITAGLTGGIESRTGEQVGLSSAFLEYNSYNGFGGGIGIAGKEGSLGVSFSSGTGLNVSANVHGRNAISQNLSPVGSGSARFTRTGLDFILPLERFSFSFSYSKTRYWHFNNKYVDQIGALYANEIYDWTDSSEFPTNIAYDVHEVLNGYDLDEAKKEPYFATVSYDSYSVSAQGLQGSIQPSLEEGTLYNQSTSDVKNILPRNGIDNFTKNLNNNSSNGEQPVSFYFVNEFSSYLNKTKSNWLASSSQINGNAIADYKPGDAASTVIENNERGYNTSKYRKKSGSFIETYTNRQILANNSLVINPYGFDRSSSDIPEDGIGAYKITSLDGKTYHYTLPVYQKEKIKTIADKDEDIDLSFYEIIELEKYATHWLLTAITGPDYVDTNNNNVMDDNDYGYWVNFEYGKWSDGFLWRTPYTGEKTIAKTKSKQFGLKEVYYLDAIKTRTHSAFFIKKARNDDYSKSFRFNKSYTIPFERSYAYGKSGDIYTTRFLDRFEIAHIGTTDIGQATLKQVVSFDIDIDDHKSLYLEKIALFDNDRIPSSLNRGVGGQTSEFSGNMKINNHGSLVSIHDTSYSFDSFSDDLVNKTWNGEFYSDVFDSDDFSLNTLKEANSIIEFNYDNSLAIGSPSTLSGNGGKLTLKSVNKLGKSGTSYMPPYTFEYYNLADFDYEKEDNWGYYEDNPHNWSLKTINTPLGGAIGIEYESDDIDDEILSGNVPRVFDDDLTLYMTRLTNDRVQIKLTAEKNDIDFDDFFSLGSVDINKFYVCLEHEYWDFGCQDRAGRILGTEKPATVTEVTDSYVIIQSDGDWIGEDNSGGISWITGRHWTYDKELHTGENPTVVESDQCIELGGGCTQQTYAAMKYSINSNKNTLLDELKIGGGIRAKSITVSDVEGNSGSKYYFYDNNGNQLSAGESGYVSSGVTPYVPRMYNVNIDNISLLPAPYVTYAKVQVRSGEEDKKTTKEYNYEVLKKVNSELGVNSGELLKTQDESDGGYRFSKFIFNDYSSRIGRLKSKIEYNSIDQILSKTVMSYDDDYDQQGIFGETFYNYLELENNGYTLNATTFINHPNVNDKVTHLSNGVQTITENLEYDFITGSVLKTKSYNSKGFEVKSEQEPAYNYYAQMGSKVDNINNKNMLNQEALTRSYYKKSVNDDWELIFNGVSTWKDWGNNVWRKHKAYVWKGELSEAGSYEDFVPFKWGANETQDEGWQKISEITKYSNYSRPLETVDINGHKASSKLGDSESKVFATSNAAYNDMFYCGGENFDEIEYQISAGSPNVSLIDADILHDADIAHTGSSYLNLNSGNSGYVVSTVENTGRYKISAWVKVATGTITVDQLSNLKLVFGHPGGSSTIGYNSPELVQAGDWFLLSYYANLSPTTTNIRIVNQTGVVIHMDDFRLHPVESAMVSYVYNEWDELECILGPNNMGTKYEYDAAGRLIKTYVEVAKNTSTEGGFHLQKTHKYTYKYQNN